MGNMLRRDPLREMWNMSRAMDRFLDRTMDDSLQEWAGSFNWAVPLDVIEKEDKFLVKASMAGIKPEDLEITYNENTLTIKGEIKEENETEKEGHYHLRERRYGSFSRSITLPTVDPDKIEAETVDGVLVLHLPKREEVKPKRIEIKVGNGKMLDGKAK